MKQRTIIYVVLASLVLFTLAPLAQAEGLKPFVLGAEPEQADVLQAAAAARTALLGQGFEVAGSYAPYQNAVVLIVTSEALKANAAKSDFGGYGAAMRVAVPNANPALSLTSVLAITFPFNIAFGIPLYLTFARWLFG